MMHPLRNRNESIGNNSHARFAAYGLFSPIEIEVTEKTTLQASRFTLAGGYLCWSRDYVGRIVFAGRIK